MYYISINEEDKDKYEKIIVDEKEFYYKREQETPALNIKRRYSNQFTDPLFLAKDLNKELTMLKKFRNDYKEIERMTRKYINCIENSIHILEQEFKIPPSVIFEAFDIKKLGFRPEDYNILIEDENSYKDF